jgi:glycogen debranching enzyme
MINDFNSSLVRLRPRLTVSDLSRGRTVLSTGIDGTIAKADHRQGLYVYETRMLSKYRWLLDEKEPVLNAASAVEQHRWLGYYIALPPNLAGSGSSEGDPLQQTVELRIARTVGDGMHEAVKLTNHTQSATSVTLELEVDGDFTSHAQKRKGPQPKGRVSRHWHELDDRRWRLTFDYKATHRYAHQGDTGVARVHRGISLELRADSAASHRKGRITFRVEMAPHASWGASLRWVAHLEGKPLPLHADDGLVIRPPDEGSATARQQLTEFTKVQVGSRPAFSSVVQRVLDRSQTDLTGLRLHEQDGGDRNWTFAAGVPPYVAFFGRDSLVIAWEAALLNSRLSLGALLRLAATQATERDDWRDAQPGRMLHEQHADPASVLNFRPQGLYFGGVSASILYPILVDEVWRWTGDRELVDPFIEPALKALHWMDEWLRDASGFYKYRTYSEQGLKNQGWKDSADAIVHADGSQVEDPLGTCEMQAFAYAAKRRFADVLWWLDRKDEARRLYKDSQDLKDRFNQTFWLEEEGFLAMALDRHDQPVRSVGSDPGRCLFAGVVEAGLAPRVADRLLQPDLFSGWGVRTLSATHPAYNPFAYHRGTIWPVENGSLVLGFARYGLRDQMWKLARAFFETATLFEHDRLPEVLGGHPRDAAHPFPGLYHRAGWPQAWSASASFLAIQALLGVVPYAPLETLLLDPWLPDWLPEITLERLRVGAATVTLRFSRTDQGQTNYEIVALEGSLHVKRHPAPWSLLEGAVEATKAAIEGMPSP